MAFCCTRAAVPEAPASRAMLRSRSAVELLGVERAGHRPGDVRARFAPTRRWAAAPAGGEADAAGPAVVGVGGAFHEALGLEAGDESRHPGLGEQHVVAELA